MGQVQEVQWRRQAQGWCKVPTEGQLQRCLFFTYTQFSISAVCLALRPAEKRVAAGGGGVKKGDGKEMAEGAKRGGRVGGAWRGRANGQTQAETQP